VANAPTPADVAVLDAHAGAIPVGGQGSRLRPRVLKAPTEGPCRPPATEAPGAGGSIRP